VIGVIVRKRILFRVLIGCRSYLRLKVETEHVIVCVETTLTTFIAESDYVSVDIHRRLSIVGQDVNESVLVMQGREGMLWQFLLRGRAQRMARIVQTGNYLRV
jgi:hypothetical protein